MATQINSIALTNLSLGLHNDFHNQVSNLITAAGAEELHIATQAAEYAALLQQENAIVKRQTAYVSTAELKEADKLRDNALGVVMQVINAHTTNTLTDKRTAAQALSALVAPYKSSARSDYRSETREINGLLTVLAAEEAAAHLTTLNLNDEVAQLSALNAKFDIIMSGKQAEAAERTPQTGLDTDTLRAALDAKYQEMVQVVNAYAVIQTSEAVEKFITDVNAVIMLVKQAAAGTGNSPKPDSGTATEETTAPEAEA